MLEVFKNTVPDRLCWVLFPIDNLGEAVETAKRFLTKEKIDRQMTRQSSTPFIKLYDKKGKKGYHLMQGMYWKEIARMWRE